MVEALEHLRSVLLSNVQDDLLEALCLQLVEQGSDIGAIDGVEIEDVDNLGGVKRVSVTAFVRAKRVLIVSKDYPA